MINKILKKVLIFVVAVCTLAVSMYFMLALVINSAKNKNPDKLTLEDLNELSKTVGDNRINVLMLGVDSLSGTDKDNTMRTDTMMFVSLDPKTKTGFILSIPRDTRVQIDGSLSKYNKINEAHSIGGVSLTLKEVKKLLGVDINHFVKVDYRAVNKTVDDVGGVEIIVPIDMNYDDPYANPPLHIELKQGPQLLDGDKAMQFLRFRHGYANQDLGRIESQQKFVQALLDKLLSPESLTHITDYINTFSQYVQTDMELGDMFKIASKALEIKPYNIKKEVLVGKPDYIGGVSYFVADEQGIKTQMDGLNDGEKYYLDKPSFVENEKADKHFEAFEKNIDSSVRTDTGNTDSDVKDTSNDTNNQNKQKEVYDPYIVVLNGDGKSGLGKRADDLLYVNNIDIDVTANADKFGYEKTKIYYKDNLQLAQNIQEILGAGELEQKSTAYYNSFVDVMVILGSDFTK